MAYEVTGHEIVPQNAPLSVQLYTIDGYSGTDIFDPLRDSVTYLRGRQRTT
jgi:hypothetical protein